MKVAIVHDYIKEYGGAERVVEALLEMFPGAPVYTSVYVPGYAGPHSAKVAKWNIKTSVLQHIPFKGKLLSPFRLISPYIFSRFDFAKYDLVIVSAAGTYTGVNSVKKGKNTKVVTYCHTPPRYLYGYRTAADWEGVFWRKTILKSLGVVIMHFLRMADFESAQNPDYFIANSKEVQKRIQKFYRRDSTVIYPPVDIPDIKSVSSKKKTYYLVGGRLARHKRIDLAIGACTKLNLPLKVFGGTFSSYGYDQLKEFAGDNIEFLGEVDEKTKLDLFMGAKAFIFPSDHEDFGIVPVEAMAVGTPVIAYNSGGVKETVIEGKTGYFFDELTVSSLVKTLKHFDKSIHRSIRSEDCIKQAKKFSKQRFKKEMTSFLNKIS